MRYTALATDYDGTLASDGRVAAATLRALERLAASGRKLILVTGRELDELLAVFPEIGVFDRVVAENGAVLYTPTTKAYRTLGEAPSPGFVSELLRRGVEPLSVGRSIVSTVHPNETIVLETIRDLGLEMQVIFNKGAVMVLPASLNKATGLAAALEDLGLSPRNVVAIGDAENDHALLRMAEFGVAVANAVPTLQMEADHTSAHENSHAVIELVGSLIDHDLRGTPPRAPRREILLGHRADGNELRMPPASFALLIAGSVDSEGSTLALGVLERVTAEGYQFCVIDSEGNYGGLPGAVVLGASDREPTVDEVMTALHTPNANVVVNVVCLPLPDRSAFFVKLLNGIRELHATTGRPHWILADETSHLLPRTGDEVPVSLADAATGMIYVTAHPDRLAVPVLRTIDLVVALGKAPSATLASIAASAGVAPPGTEGGTLEPGNGLAWFRSAPGVAFKISVTLATEHSDAHRI
jgi:hydroxymethylpyrimidine pyrophosphatase-like HAD family hydrolase